MTTSPAAPARAPESTAMFREAAEAARVVSDQIEHNRDIARDIGRLLRERDPAFMLTVARGSSDHAATYGKYLVETRSGLFTASAAPSVNSIYKAPMQFERGACIVISQSGASPDLLAVAEAARRGGAPVIALVNVESSPLAEMADAVLPLRAGPENSVAATKSFIGSLSALVQLTAEWQDDQDLRDALATAPEHLAAAWDCDWSAALEPIMATRSLFTLGRGIGLGIAQEAALKFKEVCGLHAEAYSSAEVLHGPVTIARDAFPMLVMAQDDATAPGVRDLVAELSGRDLTLMTAGVTAPGAIELPTPSAHPVIEPLLRIQSFYRLANQLSLALGQDPDNPPFLRKVTATV
ncbi:SIS domain-containing protein [Marinihelvus fidelis]|nr:SIS domain-containing protein [Marinihelvus fidelis]